MHPATPIGDLYITRSDGQINLISNVKIILLNFANFKPSVIVHENAVTSGRNLETNQMRTACYDNGSHSNDVTKWRSASYNETVDVLTAV